MNVSLSEVLHFGMRSSINAAPLLSKQESPNVLISGATEEYIKIYCIDTSIFKLEYCYAS